MSYYDEEKDYRDRGIDYNLSAAFHYNAEQPIKLDDIEKVLAMFQGENDGASWAWIAKLKNDKYAYLQGGCDYTGWYCQSGLDVYVVDSLELALQESKSQYGEGICEHLQNQIETSKKDLSWREEHDSEFVTKEIVESWKKVFNGI